MQPWPNDSVVIVASRAGTERREKMGGIHPAVCRHCNCTVHADTFTVRRAFAHPARKGRPLSFFRLECHVLYDREQLNVTEFHNTEAGRAEAAQRMAAGQ